jgi:hypothetical protein
LVIEGVLRRSLDALQPAFKTLRNTTAFSFYETKVWPNDLLVTSDFAWIVQASSEQLFGLVLEAGALGREPQKWR